MRNQAPRSCMGAPREIGWHGRCHAYNTITSFRARPKALRRKLSACTNHACFLVPCNPGGVMLPAHAHRDVALSPGSGSRLGIAADSGMARTDACQDWGSATPDEGKARWHVNNSLHKTCGLARNDNEGTQCSVAAVQCSCRDDVTALDGIAGSCQPVPRTTPARLLVTDARRGCRNGRDDRIMGCPPTCIFRSRSS